MHFNIDVSWSIPISWLFMNSFRWFFFQFFCSYFERNYRRHARVHTRVRLRLSHFPITLQNLIQLTNLVWAHLFRTCFVIIFGRFIFDKTTKWNANQFDKIEKKNRRQEQNQMKINSWELASNEHVSICIGFLIIWKQRKFIWCTQLPDTRTRERFNRSATLEHSFTFTKWEKCWTKSTAMRRRHTKMKSNHLIATAFLRMYSSHVRVSVFYHR